MRAAGVLDEIVLAPFGSEETGELVRLLAGRRRAGRGGAAAGGRPPAASRCSSWRPRGAAAGGRPRTDAPTDLDDRPARPLRPARRHGPPGRRAGRRDRTRLRPRAAVRGRGPAAGHRGARGRRAVAAAHPARARPGLRLLPRPAARHGVPPGQPAGQVAPPPAPGAVAGDHLRRPHRRGGRPAGRPVRPRRNAARAIEHYHRAAEVAARVFAHAEAIRLHRAALEQLAGLRARRRPRPAGGPDAHLDGGLAQRAARLLRRRAGVDPGAHGRPGRATLPAGRRSGTPSWPCGPRASCRGTSPGRTGWPSARSGSPTRLRAVPRGADRRRCTSRWPGPRCPWGCPATAVRHFEITFAHATDEQSLSIGSHPAIHARAWSAHGYWLLGEAATAEANAAEAIDRARAVEHPYSLAIALAYAAGHLAAARRTGSASRPRTGELGRAQHPPRLRLLPRVGPGARRLAAGRRHRHRPAWSRASPTCGRRGAFARMPYWLSLLAERTARTRARAILDSAVVSARVREDRWWLPEVLRQRAGLSSRQDAVDAAQRGARARRASRAASPSPNAAARPRGSLRTPAERPPS